MGAPVKPYSIWKAEKHLVWGKAAQSRGGEMNHCRPHPLTLPTQDSFPHQCSHKPPPPRRPAFPLPAPSLWLPGVRMRREVPSCSRRASIYSGSAFRLLGARLRRVVVLLPLSGCVSALWVLRFTPSASGEFERILPRCLGYPSCRLPQCPALPFSSPEWTRRDGNGTHPAQGSRKAPLVGQGALD